MSVQHEKGKDLDRPAANRRYFGRVLAAEVLAREFDKTLHGKKSAVLTSPLFLELAH